MQAAHCDHMALAADGSAFAWGGAQFGVLGIGDVSALPSDPADEHDHYQAEPVAVKGLQGVQIQQVAYGILYSLGLAADGSVFVWGSAWFGRLGIGDVSALLSDPADEDERYQPKPVAVKGLQGVQIQQVACGIYHSMALAAD